jgi:hypothetical protein
MTPSEFTSTIESGTTAKTFARVSKVGKSSTSKASY